MKHYTLEQAEKEVGKSKSYAVALKISIKKWKEIVKYGEGFYGKEENCGYCFVDNNRYNDCSYCPVQKTICRMVDKITAKEVLQKLQERQRKNKRRNERRK